MDVLVSVDGSPEISSMSGILFHPLIKGRFCSKYFGIGIGGLAYSPPRAQHSFRSIVSLCRKTLCCGSAFHKLLRRFISGKMATTFEPLKPRPLGDDLLKAQANVCVSREFCARRLCFRAARWSADLGLSLDNWHHFT